MGSNPGLLGQAGQGMPGEGGEMQGNTLDSWEGICRHQSESSLLLGRNRTRPVKATSGPPWCQEDPSCSFFF